MSEKWGNQQKDTGYSGDGEVQGYIESDNKIIFHLFKSVIMLGENYFTDAFTTEYIILA